MSSIRTKHTWKPRFQEQCIREKLWQEDPRLRFWLMARHMFSHDDRSDERTTLDWIRRRFSKTLGHHEARRVVERLATISTTSHCNTAIPEDPRIPRHGGPVWAMKLSPDGSHLYSGSYDKTIKVWDTARALVCKHTRRQRNGKLSTIHNNMLLVSGSWDGNVHFWNQHGRVVGSIQNENAGDAIYCLE